MGDQLGILLSGVMLGLAIAGALIVWYDLRSHRRR